MELYVGYLAAFMGTICWLPQAWKAWASRDTSGLSLAANLMFLLTVSLWFVYGIMVNDWPIMIANICAILIVVSIVAAKLRYK
ncbi:SemiSWEET family sugar transporter [Pseudophaeobacter sp. TrK17]|jgi:MtN3 and saliva related transmembrane protein|uniref:SemiSWEET family sugar transporter n=1 Tax=Pseudophaeobacter sp. TrK17 TaxID=2815167 RepID=UPI0035D136B8